MNKTVNRVCQACGKPFYTDNKDFCSSECETYYDRFLDDHEDDMDKFEDVVLD